MLCNVITWRYKKRVNFNFIYTSNMHQLNWITNIDEDDTNLCALNRIIDNAIVFGINDESY